MNAQDVVSTIEMNVGGIRPSQTFSDIFQDFHRLHIIDYHEKLVRRTYTVAFHKSETSHIANCALQLCKEFNLRI